MSETKPMSARATPRPWAAQEPDEDGIAIIGLRTNNGVPYDSPTNGIVALVVMWPTEVDANDTERAKANAAFIVDAVNSHEALKTRIGAIAFAMGWTDLKGMTVEEYAAYLKAKAAAYDACSSKIDCLSRGAVPVRDDGAGDFERVFRDACDEAGCEYDNEALLSSIANLKAALESIRQFGSDTLSGRADGPDDREWQREGVREMTARARAALQPKDTAK